MDGDVSKEEFAKLLKGLGEEVTDDVATELMNTLVETDEDGKVKLEEFYKAALSK